jgi:hypothetical protein
MERRIRFRVVLIAGSRFGRRHRGEWLNLRALEQERRQTDRDRDDAPGVHLRSGLRVLLRDTKDAIVRGRPGDLEPELYLA